MTKVYNDTFKKLLEEYGLPENLVFSIEIPAEVQEILDDKIIESEFGIALESNNELYQATESWDNQSLVEDRENHFHVDWYIEPIENRKAFMLGVRTLSLLATKFQECNLENIRFVFSFQTPEMGKEWSMEMNHHQEGDNYYVSDRLSFHKRRHGEEVISIGENDNSHWAILVIDI